jgi:proteasome accessory factor A
MKSILGTETEFGLSVMNADSPDPVSNAIFLVNSYPQLTSSSVLWDYENENPLVDARGFEVEGERERPGPEYNRLLNKPLSNGGRLYVDGAHPEYSTPECTNARDVVAYEKAGERILAQCSAMAERRRNGESRFSVYKNNTDSKGNSYGYHENYLVSRAVPFDLIVDQLTPFLVTRQIFAGAGKVGAENRTSWVDYQISQRADFFEVLIDLNTMVKRPIINTRDEPHADPVRYRRFHVIVGDANMSEISTYLKVGTTALVLAMLEEGRSVQGVALENPVQSIKEVSRDLTLKKPIKLARGIQWRAVEIQRAYWEAARLHFAGSDDPAVREVLERWGVVLDVLDEDPMRLDRELDWVIKKRLIESYMGRKSCGWRDPRVSMMNLQYHDVVEERGLYYALERGGHVERLLTDDARLHAEDDPPSDTRAYFRGACMKKFPKEVYATSWTSVLFEVGDRTVKRVPLMDPLKGSAALVQPLLSQSQTVSELLARMAT